MFLESLVFIQKQFQHQQCLLAVVLSTRFTPGLVHDSLLPVTDALPFHLQEAGFVRSDKHGRRDPRGNLGQGDSEKREGSRSWAEAARMSRMYPATSKSCFLSPSEADHIRYP